MAAEGGARGLKGACRLRRVRVGLGAVLLRGGPWLLLLRLLLLLLLLRLAGSPGVVGGDRGLELICFFLEKEKKVRLSPFLTTNRNERRLDDDYCTSLRFPSLSLALSLTSRCLSLAAFSVVAIAGLVPIACLSEAAACRCCAAVTACWCRCISCSWLN